MTVLVVVDGMLCCSSYDYSYSYYFDYFDFVRLEV